SVPARSAAFRLRYSVLRETCSCAAISAMDMVPLYHRWRRARDRAVPRPTNPTTSPGLVGDRFRLAVAARPRRRFLDWRALDRGRSPNTVRAYGTDLAGFRALAGTAGVEHGH